MAIKIIALAHWDSQKSALRYSFILPIIFVFRLQKIVINIKWS